jgi:hypothetical protein
MHDQSAHGRKGSIKAGFKNWNGQINKLFESVDELDEARFERGNPLQAVFIEAAGFNGKPQVLSQAEFDALEGDTMYRAVTDSAQVEDYKTSEVQYAGTGVYGNGSYTSTIRDTTELYAGDYNNDAKVLDSRIMEMKMLPDANVLTFDNDTQVKFFAKDTIREFEEQYKASGANPAEVQDVQWRLANEGDWTNIAIMQGVDAIKFPVRLAIPEAGIPAEYYTIVLNRGKVAINGKS